MLVFIYEFVYLFDCSLLFMVLLFILSFFLPFLSVSLSFFVCSCLINIVLRFILGGCLPVSFFRGWFHFFSLSLSFTILYHVTCGGLVLSKWLGLNLQGERPESNMLDHQ